MNHKLDFFVIGAGKSGTSSLHEYLRQHPMISLPLRKETHFFVFNRNSDSPMGEYYGRIPENYIDTIEEYFQDFEEKPEAAYYGEVCPTYLFYPNAAENINQFAPDAKLICILRNPVDRLYSNFTFFHGDANIDEFIRLVDLLPEIDPAQENFHRMLKVGCYYEQLQRYYSRFPAENIKIFLFNELSQTPSQLMQELITFLEIPEYPFNTAYKFNTSGKGRLRALKKFIKTIGIVSFLRKLLPVSTYQWLRSIGEKIFFSRPDVMPKHTRRKLQNYYREDIEKLQVLVNLDLSHWLQE